MSKPHVVTLLASATEIVCVLGYEDALVARSHKCDYPVSVTTLPACTESKIDTRNSYWTQREIAGQFMPNPYHPPVVSVTVQTWRGKRTQPVITESVPDQFAHLPQYAGGTWSYVKGYRP